MKNVLLPQRSNNVLLPSSSLQGEVISPPTKDILSHRATHCVQSNEKQYYMPYEDGSST